MNFGGLPASYDREAISGGVPNAALRTAQSHSSEDEKPHTASSSDASTIAANQDGSPRVNTDYKKYSSSTDPNSDEGAETARREQEVLQLARRLTSQSQASTPYQNPFNAPPNSPLDPNGEHFNAQAWTKAMLNLQLQDEKAAPTRTAGVCFKNLNVHGFGSSTDYQKTIGNVWLEGLSLVRKLMGNKGRKIEILQQLDGLVEAGEMLVVLGPPGSGCSTFLKTITGETHGFVVGSTSRINYQGMIRLGSRNHFLTATRCQPKAYEPELPWRSDIYCRSRCSLPSHDCWRDPLFCCAGSSSSTYTRRG